MVIKDFTIQFSGLAEGEHHFTFRLDNSFFTYFEEKEIQGSDIEVDVTLERQSRMLVFTFDIKGVVEVVCDRCADPLLINIVGQEGLIAKMGLIGESTNDEIVFLSDEDFEIDLSQHLFDFVHILMPMRLTHDDSADGRNCDPEMLRLLDQYSTGSSDSIWKDLEGLKDKNDIKN